MSEISRIGKTQAVQRDVPSTGHERNQRVDDVAKLYEKQFLREMVKAMRSTVSFGELTKPSMAENIYRDQLDNEYVENWGDQGGIGLSNLIYDQIMEKFFGGSQKGIQPRGPIPLTDRDTIRVVPLKASSEGGLGQQLPLQVELTDQKTSAPVHIQAPWDGQLMAVTREGGKAAVSLLHEGGIKSTFVFEGVLSGALGNLRPGQRVSRGQSVGVLNPEANKFLWNVGRNISTVDQSLSKK